MYFRPQDALRKWRLGKVESFYNLRLHQFNDALQICIWKCFQVGDNLFPYFSKKIPSWLSSSLNPLKSFRLDFIIVSKDLRKERGSDPELLFTSFRLDLSNFFLNFFYRTLRSYTLSPLISFRLDDPWQSVLPPPSPLEMRSPEEMIRIKNMNQMTFAKIKKMIYLAFQWIPEIIAHTLRLNLFRARSCNIGNDRFRKLVRRRKTADLPCADRRELFPRLRPFDISILLCNNY